MTALRVGDNALSGRLPRTLLDLPLDELDYADTELCAPTDEKFRAWLDAIAALQGTGAECAPATDREILEMLHDATGGRDWIDARNWLTDAPLAEWRGVEVDDQGRVVELRLWDNGLAGRLPPEFGDLAHLEYLRLSDNALTGAIPPELAGLSGLTHLALDGNALSGQIPPELGSLFRPSRSCASRTTTCRVRFRPNSAASRACAGWGSRATPGCRVLCPPN